MKRFSILCILSFVLVLCTYSQEQSFTFGKISQWEKDLKTYKNDTEAEAVVLFDIGKSSFLSTDNGLVIIFERKRRIKILKESGITYAEVDIPLYQEGNIFENILELKAITHNFDDGSFTRKSIDKDKCYTEKINDSWVNMKFAFPDVKVGSIIEYSYKLESDYIFNFRDWEFQSDIPTIYSEYESRMIPFYSYQFILKGASDFDEFDSYLDKRGIKKIFAGIEYYDMVYKYVMKDVPAFRPEEYISSRNDYLMQLDFQLSKINRPDGTEELIMTTWPELSNELIKHKAFGKFIKKSESGADKIIDLESVQQMSDIDKIITVSNAVKNNFSWNNVYGKYANSTYKELLKNKTGNSGDINLLLIGALRAAGIDAEPVILSTRNHGKVYTEYPFSSFTNYVVAYIKLNDRTIFIDATEPLADYDLMPPRSINDRGLLIRKDEPEWVSISYSKPSKEDIVIKTEFDTNPSSFNSKLSISADSYDALRIKNKFGNSTTKISDYYSSDQIKTIDDSTTILNYDISSKPLIINMYQTGSTEIINNKIYFSPFLEMVIKENPFKNTSRVYPIEMIYPYTETYNSSIVIPEAYVVDYLPEEVKFDNSLYGLEFHANQKDKTVDVYFSFTFKKGTYPSDNYLRLKNQFKMIVDYGQEKIVFKKVVVNKE